MRRFTILIVFALVTALMTLGTNLASADASGVTALATGGYQATYGGNDAFRTIEFAAVRDANNNTKGQGHLFNHTSGTKLHFEINCLHVDDNVATITGFWSRDSHPEVPYIWLQVVDNGEGNNATDIVSPLWSLDFNLTCMDYNAPSAFIPVEGGNIQVK